MSKQAVSQTLFVETLVQTLQHKANWMKEMLAQGRADSPASANAVGNRIIAIEDCIQIIKDLADTMQVIS